MFGSNICFTFPKKGGSGGTLPPLGSSSFTLFEMDGQNTLLLAGDTLLGGLRGFKWNFYNPVNVVPGTLDVHEISTGTTLATDISTTSPQDVDIGTDFIGNTGDKRIFRAFADDTAGNTFDTTQFTAKDFIVEWGSIVYYGISSNPTEDETGIESMTGVLKADFRDIYDLPANNYKYIAVPDTLGIPTKFEDANTGFIIAMNPPYSLTITNIYGVSETYNVFRSQYTLGGSVKIKIT